MPRSSGVTGGAVGTSVTVTYQYTTPSPGPYAALPLARALDPRLVSGDLGGAIRAALDGPADGYAERAAEALQPCIALAGQVLVGSREMRTLGVESAYSVVDLVGEQASFGDPAGSLAALAERTARTWSH